MTELTQEQLAEIRRQQSAWNAEFRVRPSKPNIGIEDFCAMHASVTRMLHHIDHQAARIAELEYRVKRALSGDLYALLTDIQNGIDALGHKDMANSAIQRIDALLIILEGDSA